MTTIRPFRALRYAASAGEPHQLVAPLSEDLTPESRDRYALRSEYNAVHLTLPESRSDDRSKFVQYARAAAALAAFQRDERLVRDDLPALYRLTQTYSLPRSGAVATRVRIFALLGLGEHLAHETVPPAAREERLRLLEATRTHLEPVEALVPDPDGRFLAAITDAPGRAPVLVTTDDGVAHQFEPLTDPALHAEVQAAVADGPCWLTDGFARYEAARAFQAATAGNSAAGEPKAEDYVLAAIGSERDSGLAMLPLHRLLTGLPFDEATLLERLGTHFGLVETHTRNLLVQESEGVFGLALGGGRGYHLMPRTSSLAADLGLEPEAPDADVLTRGVLEELLGVRPGPGVVTVADPAEATRAVDQGAPAAFLMRTPSLDALKRVATSGRPGASSAARFFPKAIAGLAMWSLGDTPMEP